MLGLCIALAAVILILMPGEKTLGWVIKIVYLHGALSRAGMVGLWAAGIAGAGLSDPTAAGARPLDGRAAAQRLGLLGGPLHRQHTGDPAHLGAVDRLGRAARDDDPAGPGRRVGGDRDHAPAQGCPFHGRGDAAPGGGGCLTHRPHGRAAPSAGSDRQLALDTVSPGLPAAPDSGGREHVLDRMAAGAGQSRRCSADHGDRRRRRRCHERPPEQSMPCVLRLAKEKTDEARQCAGNAPNRTGRGCRGPLLRDHDGARGRGRGKHRGRPTAHRGWGACPRAGRPGQQRRRRAGGRSLFARNGHRNHALHLEARHQGRRQLPQAQTAAPRHGHSLGRQRPRLRQAARGDQAFGADHRRPARHRRGPAHRRPARGDHGSRQGRDHRPPDCRARNRFRRSRHAPLSPHGSVQSGRANAAPARAS